MRTSRARRADRVAEAMAATPRAGFLTDVQRSRAHVDAALPLFNNQTNSQPSTVARMLRLLDVPVGASVLDVGAGSGWTTAILAHLTGRAGSVLGVERDPALADFGAANLARTGRSWARVQVAVPGVLGCPEQGPFDRILVSAMARRLPPELVGQLVPGAVMVIPVDGRMWQVTAPAHGAGPPAVDVQGHYRFVPLIVEEP